MMAWPARNGSGIQSNLLTRVREANVPYHAFAIRHQRIAA